MKMRAQEKTSQMLNPTCSSGHNILNAFKLAAISFVNCIFKNFVSKINDSLHSSRKRDSQIVTKNNRKIAKLSE